MENSSDCVFKTQGTLLLKQIAPEAMENGSDCIFKMQGTLLLKQTLTQWIVDPTDHVGDLLENSCRQ